MKPQQLRAGHPTGSADLASRHGVDADVPFIDLRAVNARFDFGEALAGVLDSGICLRGPQVAAFEREFSKWLGVQYCVCVGNGLDALRLTLQSWMTLGVLAPGDEVLVPANSFVASALAVSACGLTLRFMDVDAATFNVSAKTVAAARTDRTRVVMPVHLYGQIADMENIAAMCRAEGLLLLEDAAQAHGARSGRRSAGTFGNAAGFSFYPTKNLGALGDAGCMVTDDPELAERVRALGNYGSAEKYRHEFEGLNSRMDELQAAVLRMKLQRLDTDNDRRRQIAGSYQTRLSHPWVQPPPQPSDSASHVWHLYVVRTTDRAGLAAHLAANGIETIVHYPCAIHRQPFYRDEFSSVRLPVTDALQHEVLSLPLSPVMSDAQVDRVIAAVNSWPGPGFQSVPAES